MPSIYRLTTEGLRLGEYTDDCISSLITKLYECKQYRIYLVGCWRRISDRITGSVFNIYWQQKFWEAILFDPKAAHLHRFLYKWMWIHWFNKCYTGAAILDTFWSFQHYSRQLFRLYPGAAWNDFPPKLLVHVLFGPWSHWISLRIGDRYNGQSRFGWVRILDLRICRIFAYRSFITNCTQEGGKADTWWISAQSIL